MKYRISAIAHYACLSQSTIRRDIALGFLVVRKVRNGIISYPQAIRAWLTERRIRCGGLTHQSRTWLDALGGPVG